MPRKLHRRFNIHTRFAVFEKVDGYVNRFVPKKQYHDELKAKYDLNHIYRFDLGENTAGFSPKSEEYSDKLARTEEFKKLINEYPETSHLALCEDIATKYGLNPEHVILTNGSESGIDLISRILINEGDFFISPSPSFYLFDEYSSRCGGKLCSLPLDNQLDYAWTGKTTEEYFTAISLLMPKIKLVWIANPNNPTGQVMDMDTIETIVKYADDHNVFVVVDEAYGEYIDSDRKINSAVSLLDKYENLIVLRTFSKAYGIAGARIGYLMTRSEMVLRGVMVHRNVFPFSQHSLLMAYSVLHDQEFISQTRKKTSKRVKFIQKEINRLNSFLMIPTSISVFMLKSKSTSIENLNELFESKGIITSPVHIDGKLEYLRVTVRDDADNEYFCQVCKEIDEIFNPKKNVLTEIEVVRSTS